MIQSHGVFGISIHPNPPSPVPGLPNPQTPRNDASTRATTHGRPWHCPWAAGALQSSAAAGASHEPSPAALVMSSQLPPVPDVGREGGRLKESFGSETGERCQEHTETTRQPHRKHLDDPIFSPREASLYPSPATSPEKPR